jgi:hypothetical protein
MVMYPLVWGVSVRRSEVGRGQARLCVGSRDESPSKPLRWKLARTPSSPASEPGEAGYACPARSRAPSHTATAVRDDNGWPAFAQEKTENGLTGIGTWWTGVAQDNCSLHSWNACDFCLQHPPAHNACSESSCAAGRPLANGREHFHNTGMLLGCRRSARSNTTCNSISISKSTATTRHGP